MSNIKTPAAMVATGEMVDEIIDTLIAWKNQVDSLSKTTAAARWAVAKAKELRVWEGKYESFKEWLEEECEISERWAYSLIDSARVITAIEDAAEGVIKLAPLREKKTLEVLRSLPDRAVTKLKGLPAATAAKVALKAIEKAEGEIPSADDIAKEVKKVSRDTAPETKRDRTIPFDNHPVLLALDNEWVGIERDLGMMELKPKAIFKRLRAAVEKVL